MLPELRHTELWVSAALLRVCCPIGTHRAPTAAPVGLGALWIRGVGHGCAPRPPPSHTGQRRAGLPPPRFPLSLDLFSVLQFQHSSAFGHSFVRPQLPFGRSSAAFPVTPSPHGVWGCSGAEGSGWDHAQILLGSPRSHKPPLSAGPTACPTGRPTARFQRHCMKCGAEMGPVLLYRSPTNGGHGVSPAPQRRVWGHGQVGGTGTALGTWMGLGAQDVGTGKWGWEQLGPQE